MNKYAALAKDIYDWCIANNLWGDNTIYFDGKAWSNGMTWAKVRGVKIAKDLYEYENKNPKDYFEYANPETLSMSFEGSLNYLLNGYYPDSAKLIEEFDKLFEKYDLYYEFGHSWNLAAYPM